MHSRAAIRAALTVLVVATGALGAAFAYSAPGAEGTAAAPPSDVQLGKARAAVVSVLGIRLTGAARSRRSSHSLASGVIYDRAGRVVTVASAVRDCDSIRVRLADGREMPAKLVGRDDDSDVGVLQLPARDLPALTLTAGNVDATGQVAYALSGGAGAHPRVTIGEVRRRYEEPLGSLLLLSNEVYPGFSGGPVVDRRGELLGLVVGRLEQAPADWTDGPVSGPASFALAADDLTTILGQIEKFGRVRRGFLGVRMVQGEVVDAARPDDPFRIGVRVEEVLAGSPAAELDLAVGDLIVGWNGETLQSPEDLMRRVEASPPGTIVPLVWVRNEERREGRLVVGEKPADDLVAAPRGPSSPDSTARPREGG
jgi:S1-C subfamily serine protease